MYLYVKMEAKDKGDIEGDVKNKDHFRRSTQHFRDLRGITFDLDSSNPSCS